MRQRHKPGLMDRFRDTVRKVREFFSVKPRSGRPRWMEDRSKYSPGPDRIEGAPARRRRRQIERGILRSENGLIV
jgi:hypothetical protein